MKRYGGSQTLGNVIHGACVPFRTALLCSAHHGARDWKLPTSVVVNWIITIMSRGLGWLSVRKTDSEFDYKIPRGWH